MNHENHESTECIGTSFIGYQIGLDRTSDRIGQRAMPIGSLHIRAWRMRNGRWRLFVVRVDPWTGWSDWWPVENVYDLKPYVLRHPMGEGSEDSR